MPKLNINDNISVKLNEWGFSILRKRYEALKVRIPYTPPKVDEDGYIKIQLWDFMEVFGPFMVLGGRMPFNPEILIPETRKNG